MQAHVRSMRRSARRGAVTTGAFLLWTLLAPHVDAYADEPILYSFDVELGPVRVDGTFAFTLQTSSGPVDATLDVDTDVRGKLKGYLVVGGRGLVVKGTARRAGDGLHVAFRAGTGREKVQFTGDVAPGSTQLQGTATGKGFVLPGTSSFSVDLGPAGPHVATVEFGLVRKANGRIGGTGHVLACGDEVKLRASGKFTPSGLTLALKKGGFRFSGVGTAADAVVTLDWDAAGFGGSGSGTSLVLVEVTPPEPLTYPSGIPGEFEIDSAIPTIFASSGDVGPRGRFTVSPPLPAGLVLDAATARISGTPTEVKEGRTYTVTGSNYAGTTSAALAFRTRIPRSRSFAPETRYLTDADLRRFLQRAEFGVRQLGGGTTSLDRVRTMGLDAYVDAMLVLNANGPAEAVAAPELANVNDPPALRGKFPSPAQVARWWGSLMMNSDNPFQERLAFFWADRFAVSAEVFDTSELHFVPEYVNLYRFGGNGNLRTLLLQMARSGAMLEYLNGNLNTAGQPNENFAREFWELFTLGVDQGYTQADIVESSRAFTGWKFVTDPATGLAGAVFDPARHDTGQKSVLGQTIPAQAETDDFQSMVNVTLDRGPAAEFLATCIFEHFAFESPHPDLVAEMAASLRTAGYELTPFLRQLFRSEAFFSSPGKDALVKNPVDYTVGFIHLTGLKITTPTLQQQLELLAQTPGSPGSVNGYPYGTAWFSAQNMADRSNFAEVVIGDTVRQRQVGIEVATILPPPDQRSAENVVDHLARLFGLTLVDEERRICIDHLNLGSAFDATQQSHLDERVRGLLFVLSQHPSYMVR